MASNNDDHDDMDMGLEESGNIIDVEGIDEPLSATPRGGAEEYDHDGTDDYGDDVDEESESSKPKKKSGGLTKIMAPMLVLLAAAGAGGYIVMNPSILGGSPAQVSAIQLATPPAAETAVLPPAEASGQTQELAVNEAPPQPIANLNESPEVPAASDMPPPDAVAPVPDVTAEVPVQEDVPADNAAATPAAEAVTSVEAAPPEVPAGDAPIVAQEDSVQALMGSDVDVAPEAMAVQDPATSVVPPAVSPEVTPEAATTPVADASADPVPPADVTEPTFVPAVPSGEQSAIVPAEVVGVAEPPVMNVDEVNGAPAPDMPPRTVAQAPAASPAMAVPEGAIPSAAGGEAAAPVTPLPADNESSVYYDSLAQVPSGAMATSVGPREINPVLEPASKMVIVNKDKGAGSQEALLVSANRALKLKRYDSALEMFDQLYAKNNRDVRILMGRAVAQQNMGLNESAVQSYEEVLALKPDHTEALLNMMGLVRSQYPEVALRRLLELYSKHPNNAGIAAQIGVANAELGHFDDAMRYLGIAATLEPGNAQHLFNMAIAADRKGDSTQAVKLYERALEVDVTYGASRSVPRDRIYDRLSVLRRG